MNRKVLLVGLAVVAPLIGLLLMSLGRNPHQVDSPLVGRAAPPFTLAPVGGGPPISTGSLAGKPLVVNFWATWCAPCYQEHGVLHDAARQYGDEVRFLGIVYEDEEERVGEFLRQAGSTYPSLMDPHGRTAVAYGVFGVPETFFIDGAGRIVAKEAQPLTPALLANRVALAQKGMP